MCRIFQGLKTATEIELPVLMASFFQNSLINCDFLLRYKIAFSAIQKLKLFSLLKIKEGLKTATEIELPVLMRVFFKNSLIVLRFFASLQNRVFSNSKVETFFITEK